MQFLEFFLLLFFQFKSVLIDSEGNNQAKYKENPAEKLASNPYNLLVLWRFQGG